MTYNPNIHHRRSIRLKGYDYSQKGAYFVTICCQNMVCRFGKVENGEMKLNDSGKMVEKWCAELSNKFPDIELGEYVVMPNHFHVIIINNGSGNAGKNAKKSATETAEKSVASGGATVGANLCVCPNKNDEPENISGEHADGILGEHADGILGEHADGILGEHADGILGEHVGSPLRMVVQWFKTMTTNEYIRGVKTLGWPPFDKKLWQRNYWERIIWNEKSYKNTTDYIANNPKNWGKDKFHT